MNIQHLNQCLVDISRLYSESLSIREELEKYRNDEIIDQIVKQDKSPQREEGCIRRSVLLEWINSERFKQMRRISIEQISSLFPFQKISFTVLITISFKRINYQHHQTSKLIPKSSQQPSQTKPIPLLLTNLIRNSLQINHLKKQVIPMIELYIPMSQKNLTLQELKDYLLLGGSKGKLIEINPRYVIMALNGTDKNDSVLQFQLYQRDKQTDKEKENLIFAQERNQDSAPSAHNLSKIRQIMNRLNKRVDNFGNQWLLNHPQADIKKSLS